MAEQDHRLQGRELADAIQNDPAMVETAREGLEALERGRYASVLRLYSPGLYQIGHWLGSRRCEEWALDPGTPERDQVEVIEDLHRLTDGPLNHWDLRAGLSGYLDGRSRGDYVLYINLRRSMDEPCPGCGRLVDPQGRSEGACRCGLEWREEPVPRNVLAGLGVSGDRNVVRWGVQ